MASRFEGEVEVPVPDPEEMDSFLAWAKMNGVNEPLSPLHHYDNVSAFRAGVNRSKFDPMSMVRSPVDEELKWFKTRPKVAGRADPDSGMVVLNPYSKLSKKEQEGVIQNEIARLAMWQNNIVPDFDLTPEQNVAFRDYGDDLAQRETIVGRIISGDPSALNATPEQIKWANEVKKTLPQGHFPDTYKLPPHSTFSVESMYYQPHMKAGYWEGDKYVPINSLMDAPQKVIDYYKKSRSK